MVGNALSLTSNSLLKNIPITIKRHWLFSTVLLAALFVRLWGLDFGLPYAYHVDEPRYIYSAVGIIQSGNLNPGWFQQPSLYTYLVTLVLGIYFIGGWLTGTFQSQADLFQPPYHFDGYIPLSAEFLLPRLLTVTFGVATVIFVYWVARRWLGQVGGLAAAAFLSLSIFHSESSHYIATDVPVALFIVAALYFFYRVSESGENKYYLMAGIMAGLAIGTKYSAYVLAVPAGLAHLMAWRQGKSRPFSLGLVLLGVSTVLIFLLTTPYALFDSQQFTADVQYELDHHRLLGHVGAEGNSGIWLIEQLLSRSDRWLTLLATVGFGLAVWRRNRPMLLILAFTLTYFISMASNLVRFERFLVPMIPTLALGAGYTFSVLQERLPETRQGFLLVVGLLLLVEPALSVGRFNHQLAQTDVRTLAREWIVENIPADTLIARERYTPHLDNPPYTSQLFERLNENPPEWYVNQNFDYIIVAEARYRNLYKDPERYAADIAAYEALFNNLELVKTFNGPYVGRPNHDIRIYRPPS